MASPLAARLPRHVIARQDQRLPRIPRRHPRPGKASTSWVLRVLGRCSAKCSSSDGDAGVGVGGLWSSQVRKLESQGVPTKQAEAITEVLNDSLDSMSESFVSKADIQKVVLGISWRAVSYLMV